MSADAVADCNTGTGKGILRPQASTNGLFFLTQILFFLLRLCGTAMTKSDSSNVNRLNYDVMFIKHMDIRPVTSIWFHSYEVIVPRLEFAFTRPSFNVSKVIRVSETWAACMDPSDKNY